VTFWARTLRAGLGRSYQKTNIFLPFSVGRASAWRRSRARPYAPAGCSWPGRARSERAGRARWAAACRPGATTGGAASRGARQLETPWRSPPDLQVLLFDERWPAGTAEAERMVEHCCAF
jgi:branched-chain amino acid transport system ATP-binding protein